MNLKSIRRNFLNHASYPKESEHTFQSWMNPKPSRTHISIQMNPSLIWKDYLILLNSFAIRKSFQISIRMNLVSTRVNPIESNTKSKEFETNLKKLSFLLNPMSKPNESDSFR